jgi:hypothetical protein
MPNFPGSLDDDVSLYLAVNNARTRLTSGISESELTIPVVTTSGFPSQGFITILSNPDDITEAEAIRYDGISETTFSGVERGAGGTPIFPHFTQDNVDLTVMAEHHNELKDAIIEIEKILGVSGSHNFVPKDAQGNAIVSGTLTAENLFEAGWITASGNLVVCGEAEFKDDVYFATNTLVSGTATFGVLPASTVPQTISVFDDVGGTGTGNSYTTQLTTPPLPSGDNLLLYRGNMGWDPTSANTGQMAIRSIFAGIEAGLGEQNTSVKNGHGHGAEVAGFKVVSGDGVNTASLQTRAVAAGSRTYEWGAAALVSIPLGEMGLVENTDYWYDNGQDTAQGTTSSSFATFNTLNFTVPDAGDYIFFFSTEMDSGIQSRTRFRMDGSVVFTQAESGASNERTPGAGAVVVNLTAGAHTATFQQSCNNAFGSSSNTYRSRMFVLRAASFSQVQYSRSSTDQASASAVFTQLSNVGTITHTPATQEQVLLLGTAGHFSTNDDTSATYQITNTTDAESYAIDSGQRVGNNASDDVNNRQSFFFRTLDDVSLPKTFELQHRRYNGASTTTTTDAALVVLGLSQPVVSTDTPVTTIVGNEITTHEVTTDVLTTKQLNVDDITVTGTLDVTEGTSYLGETFTYDLTTNNITATGTACFVEDVDIKSDLTVSGTAKFGQAAPAPVTGEIIFASQDTVQTTTSSSLVDANCETTPLLDGIEYLVIYAGNCGSSNTSSRSHLRCVFGSTNLGEGSALKSTLGTFGNNNYNGVDTQGIMKVTGNGVDTVKFQFRHASSSTAYAGAMSILCIPLDQYTEGTDYYYSQTANNDTFVITNATQVDPPETNLVSDTFNGMAAGKWIFLWSNERTTSNFTGRGFSERLVVDGTTVGPARFGRSNDASGSGSIFTLAAANTVNIASSGNKTVQLKVASRTASEADFRRGRVFAINTAAFSQVLNTTDSTGSTTNSTSYVDFSSLNTTITPSQPNSDVIIFASAPSYTKNSNSGFASALRNETDGVDYRDDSGSRDSAIGGGGSTNINLNNSFMVHYEQRTSATEYRYRFRSEGGGDVAVGRNEDDNGGELSEMIVWEFNSPGAFVPITQTCIDDDSIQTGSLVADTVQARQSLTISGVPVATGTSGGAGVTDPLVLASGIFSDSLTVSGVPVAAGDFVEVSGDEMTGNLNMQGNNIYNTGVVAMQDDAPTVVTSGLLWFDTDAPGAAFSSSNLPGGYLGSLVAASTGTTTSNGAWSTIGFDVVEYNRGGFVDPVYPSRLIVPSGVNRVELAAGFRFDSNSTGDRRIQIYKNGAADTAVTTQSGVVGVTILPAASASDHLMQTFTPVLEVEPGDYFETRVQQSSGGNLDIEPLDKWFAIKAVDTRGVPGVNTVNLLQGDVSLVAGSGIAIRSSGDTNQIEIGFANQVSDAQIWNPDAPPANPSVYDDEWLDTNNTLDPKWTDWDPGSVTATNIPNIAQMLQLKHNPPSSAASLGGVFQDAPSGDFTVYAKFHYLNNITRDFHEFGLLFAEDLTNNPSTDNLAVVAVPAHRSGGEDESYYFGLATQHFNSYSSFDTNKDFRSIQFPANEPIYVRARVDVSARTVTADASLDGIQWSPAIVGDFSGDLTTIDEIGIWANSATTTEMVIHCEYFRVVEHIDPTLPMQGDFVTLSGIPQSAIVISGSGGGGGTGDGNITDINTQEGPSITISGAGSVDVITEPNLIIVSGTGGGETSGTATVSGCYSHNQTVATGTWTVDHNLGTQTVNYIVLDNSGSQVQPDDFTIVDDNQVSIDFVTDRTGIANIFACVDDEVTFEGGSFSSITAVTGTFTTGITVGTGTTYITGSGIDTPELKINGQAPSFGGGVEFLGTFTDDGTRLYIEDLPSGYRRFEIQIVGLESQSATLEALQVRLKSDGVGEGYTNSNDVEGVVKAARNTQSANGGATANEINYGVFQTANRFYLVPNSGDWNIGRDADQTWNGVINIVNVGSATSYPYITFEGTYFSDNDRLVNINGGATRYVKNTLTGLRVELNAGGALTATAYLYGYPE